jgi:23S rRNA (cytidine1920-2'-O)/16S rRNA (cytidine1409-2'-O)-methyltransferase
MRGEERRGRAAGRREGAVKRRERVDTLTVTRGLAESRSAAEAAIRAGEIYVAGQRVDKPGTMVAADASIERRRRGPGYVSRGGYKLAAALDAFAVDAAGAVVLDVGASTGGFTDCVLQRGAARVYAVDVGHGQLHWRLRRDPRVVVMEGRHAARLRPADLPAPVDLATIDCSFISLLKVLPAVAACLRPGGVIIALIKPQFEVGPKAAPRGVVGDPDVHARVVRAIVDGARGIGLVPGGVIASPLLGPDGNREFLLLVRVRPATGADDMDEQATRAVYGARRTGGATP